MAQAKNFDRPNVLVAGGAGFIGSNICESLLDEYNVICVDNYSSGHESNIDELLSHPHFEFIRHDIREPFDFSSHTGVERFRVAHVGIQHIIHAAGSGSHVPFIKDPIAGLVSQAEGTRQLLELAVSSHARFLFLSDGLAYGVIAGDGDIVEGAQGVLSSVPMVSRNAEGKRYAEALIATYADLYSIETMIIRLGSIYGQNMHLGDGRLVPTLIERALHNEEIVLSKGLTDTSVLFISDALDAIKLALASELKGVYNLGGATVISVAALAQTIIQHLGSSSGVREGDAGATSIEYAFWEAQSRVLSIAKIKEGLEWFPVIRIEDGLAKTIDYMKSLRGVKRIDV